MRLTVFTDYTLRVLIYLTLKYKSGERATIQDIAEAYGISRNHLMKIVHQLSQHGIIETTRGRAGGMTLSKPPQDITVGAIVRISEPDFDLVECHQEGRQNDCAVAGVCQLNAGFRRAQRAFLHELDQISFDHAVTTPRVAASLLGMAKGEPKFVPIVTAPMRKQAAARATRQSKS